jgi:hypothetical protein
MLALAIRYNPVPKYHKMDPPDLWRWWNQTTFLENLLAFEVKIQIIIRKDGVLIC